MPGKYPLKAIVQQLLNGLHHSLRSPDQPPRCLERSSLGIPPEVVAGEQKPTIVQQRAAARRVAWHRDELEFWSEADGLQPIDDPFRIRHRLRICTVDDARGAEAGGVSGSIG